MNFVSQAHDFIAEGLNPVPLKKDKSPKLPQGHDYLYKTIDKVETLFSNCEMIGIVCGAVSGGFYCLDFDKHKGEDIKVVFDDFLTNPFIQYIIKQGKLSLFQTPSGGFHCYYKSKIIEAGCRMAAWEDLSTMIEIRGHGQYAATSPSAGYKYIAGAQVIKLDYLEDDELNQLKTIAGAFTKEPIEHKKKSGKKWAETWTTETVDGKFNLEQGPYAKELLKEAGWKMVQIRKYDGVELWQRPGKDEGISATFGKFNNMFYCFTGNGHPFKQEEAYSPFKIYTELKYGGDWRKAKDSLKPKLSVVEEDIPTAHDHFPIDVFPKFIQDYIKELNRTLNFHMDFSAAAAMFTVATSNGNRYKLRVKNGWEAPTIFWFACVGYPGTIKTHPVKMLTRPLNKIDVRSKDAFDEELKHYDPESKQPRPKFKQLLISDYTLEALHSIHDINKRGIGLYKDELKGFLNDMNKYRKGSDEEFWLESFNNGSYIVNRVTKDPVMINNICINIIGTIQHDVLHKVVTQYAGNGLIDRFLFTASETTVYPLTDLEINERYMIQWNELINRINEYYSYHNHHDSETLTMGPDAFQVYKKIDEEYVGIQNGNDKSQGLKNYLSKMKTYIPRFALLLAIMESICEGVEVEVTPDHMLGAKKVADYFVSTAEKIFDTHDVLLDIQEAETNMRGLKKSEKIIKLSEKGYRGSDISRYFGMSRQAVSKIIKK